MRQIANLVLLFILFESTVINAREASSFESNLRHCRNITSYVQSRMEKVKEQNQLERDNIIDEMWNDSIISGKQKSLMIDLTRQYEYSRQNKWQTTFEYCIDNLDSPAYN